jgi:hypothetical protein
MSAKSEVKYSRQFVTVANTDGLAGDSSQAQNFQVAFSNSAFTNQQSAHDQTKTYFTPQFVSFDYFFDNVSAVLKNNRFQIRATNTADNAKILNGSPYTVIIPTGTYDGTVLATTIQTALNNAGTGFKWTSGSTLANWTVTFSVLTNRLTFSYATPEPTGGMSLTFVFKYTDTTPVPNITYNSIKLLGNIGIELVVPSGGGVTMPSIVDLAPFQAVRLHSNIAKRTFSMTDRYIPTTPTLLNPYPAPTFAGKQLNGTDILFEIPTFNQLSGTTLTFLPTTPDVYRQEIVSNFDNVTFTLKDIDGNILPLYEGSEFNITFVIEREIIQPSNEDRLGAVSDFAQFSTM